MPNDQVTTSTRLWSDEVGIAEAQAQQSQRTRFYDLLKKQPGYEFSNGKVFDEGDGPYANPAP